MVRIAVVDSGIGGIPYLVRTRQLLGDQSYIYCADNRGFPYGTKSEAQIIDSFSAMVERVRRQFRPDLFVVACNTASVVALEHLRGRFPEPFVGVVPAVKPAAIQSPSGRFGILATKRTVEGNYVQALIDRYASNCTVLRYAATDLINAIEADPFGHNRALLEPMLQAIRSWFVSNGVDTLVLACTHFLMIENLFTEIMGPDMLILDSRDGVARQAAKMLTQITPTIHQPVIEEDCFYLSAPSERSEVYQDIARFYGLRYQGVLGE